MKWLYYQITAIILLLIHCNKFVSTKVIIQPQIGYDKTSKPNKTVEILVSFNIETISVINLYKQTIKVSLEVIIEWEETRVNIVDEEEESKVVLPYFLRKCRIGNIFYSEIFSLFSKDSSSSTIELSLEKYWYPNFDISRALHIRNVILVGRSTNTVLYDTKTNIMILNRKIEVELFCPMNLNKYPFDDNACSFIMKSFYHDYDSLRFVLKSMNYSNVFEHGPNDYYGRYKIEVKDLESDKKNDFAIVGFRIEFQRNSLAAISVSFFIPSGLTVTISWMR